MTRRASPATRAERRTSRRPAAPRPRTFSGPDAFRDWLARHHAAKTEIVVRCFKTSAAGRGLTYSDALDEALAYGWIDGVRRGVDEVSFSTRFTPRRPRSIWSRVNVARVEALASRGRMMPSGLAAFNAREVARTGVYSFERAAAELPPDFLTRFRANRAAWSYFNSEAPWYRRTSTHWVMSAKKEETRLRRLAHLIECSARAERIGPLKRT